jgi:hypothetical protein
MKRFAVAALIAVSLCQPVMADSKIPNDIHKKPALFCLVAGAMSNIVMKRINLGEPIEYLYEEAAALENPQLRAYMLQSVTMASWAPLQTPGGQFSEWNYQRCLVVMNSRQ